MKYTQKKTREYLNEGESFPMIGCDRKITIRITKDLLALKKADGWSDFLDSRTGKDFVMTNWKRAEDRFGSIADADLQHMIRNDDYFSTAYAICCGDFSGKNVCAHCSASNVPTVDNVCEKCAYLRMYLSHIINLIHNAALTWTKDTTTENVTELVSEITHYWNKIFDEEDDDSLMLESSDDDDDDEYDSIYFTAAGEAGRMGMRTFIKNGTHYNALSDEVFAAMKNIGRQGASTRNFDVCKKMYNKALKGTLTVETTHEIPYSGSAQCFLCNEKSRTCYLRLTDKKTGKEIGLVGKNCGEVFGCINYYAELFREIIARPVWDNAYRAKHNRLFSAALCGMASANERKRTEYQSDSSSSEEDEEEVFVIIDSPKINNKKRKATTLLDILQEEEEKEEKEDTVPLLDDKEHLGVFIKNALSHAYKKRVQRVRIYMDPGCDIQVTHMIESSFNHDESWWADIGKKIADARHDPDKYQSIRRQLKSQLSRFFDQRNIDPFYKGYSFKKLRGWTWEISLLQ